MCWTGSHSKSAAARTRGGIRNPRCALTQIPNRAAGSPFWEFAENDAPSRPSQVNTTDNNHGSHSDTVDVSDRARALIERLTREDAQLYEVARARFERDVQKAGLDCWLENEEQLRSELGVRLSEEDI